MELWPNGITLCICGFWGLTCMGHRWEGRGAYVRSWMCEEKEFIGSLVCDV